MYRFKGYPLYKTLSLKMGSRSPIHRNFGIISKAYLCQFGKKLSQWLKEYLEFRENYIYVSPHVTLKIWSRLPKSYQLFS